MIAMSSPGSARTLPLPLPLPLVFSIGFLLVTIAYFAYQIPTGTYIFDRHSYSYNLTVNDSTATISDFTATINDSTTTPEPTPLRLTIGHDDTVSLQQVLQHIFIPNKFSITKDAYVVNGAEYKIHSEPQYTKPLGKEICIVDVDTRPFANEHQVMHDGGFAWGELDRYSAGIMNHYTYATLHGYDYKFVNAANYTDRSQTWIKPSAIANLLPDYKFVVFLDADAAFNTMHIPFEWLLNYWNITSTISIAMALDPNSISNQDQFGRVLTNTGFMIVQRNPTTMEMLRAWDDCPSERRYPGCAKWKRPRFHEQSAFGDYVRGDFDEYIKELPCNEANGEPEYDSGCRGVFVSHFWWRTDNVKDYFASSVLQALMGRIQGEMVERKEEVVKLQAENVIRGG